MVFQPLSLVRSVNGKLLVEWETPNPGARFMRKVFESSYSQAPVILSVSEASERKANIMGDKSPKAVNKHANQKQAKSDSAKQKKQQAIAAKRVAGKKS
jgi:hypothetical protein